VTALALMAGSLALPLAVAQGNAGTVKVQDDSDTGDHSNDPHVGCSFSIEGFNMAAASGNITIEAWPPTGADRSTVLNSTWTADAGSDDSGHHFVAGEFTLPSGHYKVFASNTGGHDKMKVFWVDCETASVPVFPTTATLALAALGAVGGTFVILRRKP
jgi:hypothetical protein